MSLISIIIPCHEKDNADILNAQLKDIPEFEIIISHEKFRAKAMNTASYRAKGDFLWFIHSDSTLPLSLIHEIQTKKLHHQKIYYSPFKFTEKKWFLKLTEWGVNFRCKFLNIPFGDQAFLIHKDLFKKLNMYNEKALYGEDHLLIQTAKKQSVIIESLQNPIFTSARKYLQNGWFKTTLKHQHLFYKQWYEFKKGNIS